MPEQISTYSIIRAKLPAEIPTYVGAPEAQDLDVRSFPRKGLLLTPEGETRYITNDTTVMKSKLSTLSTITLSNCNVLSQLTRNLDVGFWGKEGVFQRLLKEGPCCFHLPSLRHPKDALILLPCNLSDAILSVSSIIKLPLSCCIS